MLAKDILRACQGLSVRSALEILAHVSASLVVAPATDRGEAEACAIAYTKAFGKNICAQLDARFGRVQ